MDRLAKAIHLLDAELGVTSSSGRTVFTAAEVTDKLLDLRRELTMIHDIDDIELRLYAIRGE